MIKRVALDSETSSLDPHSGKLLLVTLCDDIGNEYYWKTQEQPVPKKVLGMLTDPDIMVIMHNASFDTKWLKHKYGIVINNVWDTMLVEKLLHLGKKGIKFDLSDVLLKHYGITLDKSEIQKFLHSIVTTKGVSMGMEDTRYLLTLQEDQANEVRHNGIENAVRIENDCAYVFGQMEYNGMYFNVDLYLKYVATLRGLVPGIKKSIFDTISYPYTVDALDGTIITDLNLNGSKQLLFILKEMGVILKNTRKETLKKYLFNCKDEVKRFLVQSVLDYRTLSRTLTWRYDKKINPVTRRLHPSYKSLGTDTGRASSLKPNGQNIQNDIFLLKPKEDGSYMAVSTGINFRDPFEAPNGWVFVSADYSQMELRTYAGVATVESILDEYKKDKPDLHRQAAAIVFNKNYEDVTKFERMLGKILNFAARTYGGGPNAIIQSALNFGIVLTWEEAENLRYKLLKADPEGQLWGKEITKKALEDGYLINLAGYKRFLDKKMCRETVCKNTPIQGLCGAILKEAMITFQQWIDNVAGYENVQLISQVHDELNALAKKEWGERALEKMRECMVTAGDKYLEPMGVNCAVDGGIYDKWQK